MDRVKEKIALLLQPHFSRYCRCELGGEWKDCSLTYLEYETLEELRRLFLENKEKYDGFITSGALPLSVLRGADQPPYAVKGIFGGFLENTYRILLNQVLRRGGADYRRIGMDYVETGADLLQILEKDLLPGMVAEFERKLLEMTEEELDQFERQMVRHYLEKCREGRLDFVVTYFHSVVDALEKEGVECCYSYPSGQSLTETLELCLKNIRLEQIQKNVPAVLRVTLDAYSHQDQKYSSRESELLILKAALLEYCRAYQIEPVLKDDFGDVELYLNLEQVARMTENYTSFDLPLWLQERMRFDGSISLGAASDLNKARYRALLARDYDRKMEKGLTVFIDEQETVHTLPVKKKELREKSGVPAAYVEKIANDSHLSSETVFRVIAAMQTEKAHEFTAYDLVRLQKFSLRIATRVLTALSGAGYAERIGQKRIGNKGRPQNLYRLDIRYDGFEPYE